MADFPSVPSTQWEDWNPPGPGVSLQEVLLLHQEDNRLVSFQLGNPSSTLRV